MRKTLTFAREDFESRGTSNATSDSKYFDTVTFLRIERKASFTFENIAQVWGNLFC